MSWRFVIHMSKEASKNNDNPEIRLTGKAEKCQNNDNLEIPRRKIKVVIVFDDYLSPLLVGFHPTNQRQAPIRCAIRYYSR